MLPPDTIHRLSDHFGQYLIDLKCRKCGHTREITPKALANLFGWSTEFKKITARFRCSKCHGRDIDVHIAFDGRPRHWTNRTR